MISLHACAIYLLVWRRRKWVLGCEFVSIGRPFIVSRVFGLQRRVLVQKLYLRSICFNSIKSQASISTVRKRSWTSPADDVPVPDCNLVFAVGKCGVIHTKWDTIIWTLKGWIVKETDFIAIWGPGNRRTHKAIPNVTIVTRKRFVIIPEQGLSRIRVSWEKHLSQEHSMMKFVRRPHRT